MSAAITMSFLGAQDLNSYNYLNNYSRTIIPGKIALQVIFSAISWYYLKTETDTAHGFIYEPGS